VLVAQLHPALKEHGFVLEARPFAAHITLVRKAALPRALPPLPEVHWPAGEFVLVRSKGGRYEIVSRFPLG
jgi:2'-5' RNA ligase